MSHLLYSSNEMYSSTELIRKSKTIFNKIINEEIDKAIILRDGKPSFMLLDFDKYEKIMAEYDVLKAKDLANLNTKVNTTIKKEKKKPEPIEKLIEEPIIQTKPVVIAESIVITETIEKINPSKVVPPTPEFKEDEELEDNDIEVKIEETITKVTIEEVVETEVQEGLEVLDDLDFDDEFKKEVERKVRERKDRELEIRKAQVEVEEEEIEEIAEIAKKITKKTELKEFWA